MINKSCVHSKFVRDASKCTLPNNNELTIKNCFLSSYAYLIPFMNNSYSKKGPRIVIDMIEKIGYKLISDLFPSSFAAIPPVI